MSDPTGKFFDSLEGAFGRGNVTSGYRSQEEQDRLVKAGKTKATRSSHTEGNGYDLAIGAAKTADEVRQIAAAKGMTVNKVIRETGVGPNQGTGPHWHIELGDAQVSNQNGAGGAYNSSKPGQGVASPSLYLDDLESKLAPETKNSSNVQQNSEHIFNSDSELANRSNAVQGQLQKQGAQIDVLDEAMVAAQTVQKNAMETQIADTRNISDQIVQGTTELKNQVLPVFKARGRVNDQLDKINTMNPLERGIRGIFDLNYDRNYLEGQLDHYDRTLKARNDDFEYLNRLHGVAMEEIGRRYQLDTGMPNLVQKQAEEDLGLTGMRITQTAGMLGNLRDKVTTESQLISAKAMAREDLIGRLDTPTVTDLMTKAQQNNGVVQFNGVEFSYKELRDRLQAGEQQELQMESYRMSIAGGRMDMATKYAENIARSLTRPQLEAAINNGGVYNGIQLPQDTLTNLYGGMVARDTTRAQVIAQQMPAKLAMDTATAHLNQVTGLYSRGKSIFGNQAMEGSSPYTDRAGQLVRGLTQAIEQGQPPEVISALTQQIAQNSTDYTKFIDDRILRQVGGDKRAAGYLKGFVYGSQLSPGTAAEALTYFAMKGNLPEGVSLSPEARQVFQKAQTIVATHRNDKVNGKAISDTQLMSIVQRDLTDSAAKIMGQARHDKLYGDLPGVAKQVGAPFGKFPAQRWSEIRAEAAQTAAESVAHSVNTTPQNVVQMLRTGKPLTNDEAGKQLLVATQKMAGQYNGVEMQTTVRLLDAEKQVTPGRRNSSVMGDFLGSPQFATGLSSYGNALSSQTMGEYLVNPLVSGALEKNFMNTRDSALSAQATVWQTDRQLAQNPATNMLLQPKARFHMILSAIPGLGKEGADKLAPFVNSHVPEITKADEGKGMAINSRFQAQDSLMYNALASTKFDDPKLEQYRKLAVKGWQEHATQAQGWAERMVGTMHAIIAGGNSDLIPEQ